MKIFWFRVDVRAELPNSIVLTEQNRTELYFALHPRPHAGGIKE